MNRNARPVLCASSNMDGVLRGHFRGGPISCAGWGGLPHPDTGAFLGSAVGHERMFLMKLAQPPQTGGFDGPSTRTQ
jgi:hypothetical protein